ncbi:MAG: carbohydrate ABC transporter substrate-binding protein [Planctomycetes bacterium]|nr:carbohydrate ABC transporter substrate-binding protein [Planctomycetota bacterium]
MKYFFVVCLGCLILASIFTQMMAPESKSDKPIVYWVTDPNPARELQIQTCSEWQKKNNIPEFEAKVDTANMDKSKVIIQAVSGVASDVIDHAGGSAMRFYHEINFLEDLTDAGLKLGFDPSKTYKAIIPEITIDGRQYVFPCNVTAPLFWINKATFKKYGVELPPKRWTLEQFEELGKKFVEAGNKGRPRKDVFFADGSKTAIWYRSLGLDIYNETLSACIMDDPRYVKILRLEYKWTYDDHLLPSEADRQSFSTESGYGGSSLQLFNNGNYGMIFSGRYALIQMRKFGAMELTVVEPPHGGYPNTFTTTRAAGVYKAGKHKDLATYFIAYLASEDYNMNIVHDGDALPPNPEFTKSEEFLRPKDYPNEWGCHEMFTQAMDEIAIVNSASPFILQDVANRIISNYEKSYMSKICSAEEAAARTQKEVNNEIQLNLKDYPKMRPLYEERVALQKKIDEYRKAGKKVPLEWISNPFFRRYYVDMGWAETKAESK